MFEDKIDQERLTFNILNGKCCLSRNGLSFIIWIANFLWIQELLKIQCLFVQVYFQENL
jgi:hypothetical protein